MYDIYTVVDKLGPYSYASAEPPGLWSFLRTSVKTSCRVPKSSKGLLVYAGRCIYRGETHDS